MMGLSTKRLILRPFVAQDCEAVAAALNDAEVCRGLAAVPYPYRVEDAHAFTTRDPHDALAVCLKDGPLVGAVALGAQLGYWYAKPHWGKGYATEAAHAVVSRHFAENETTVLSGYVDDNHGSAGVLRKLGFVVIGDKMLHIRSRGIEVPSKSVALTKARWEAVQ